MGKVLAVLLMLFCFVLSIPLVQANPVGAQEGLSELYPVLVILIVALASFVVFLIRNKQHFKHGIIYLVMFSCWISYIAVSIYGYTNFIITAIGQRITTFGYITMSITYLTMAITIIAVVYSGFLINKKFKNTNFKQ